MQVCAKHVFPLPVHQLSQQTNNISILLLFSIRNENTEPCRLKKHAQVHPAGKQSNGVGWGREGSLLHRQRTLHSCNPASPGRRLTTFLPCPSVNCWSEVQWEGTTTPCCTAAVHVPTARSPGCSCPEAGFGHSAPAPSHRVPSWLLCSQDWCHWERQLPGREEGTVPFSLTCE